MTCQENEQYIQAFVDDRLTGDELEAFLWHINNCKACYDEMETGYLLKEALVRLEDGTSFNLHSELKEKISTMESFIVFRNHTSIIRRIILMIAGLILVSDLMYLYLYYI